MLAQYLIMKKQELTFNIIAIIVDALAIFLAAFSAYFLRFRAETLFPQYPILFNLSYSDFFTKIFFAIPVILIIFALYGLYNVVATTKFWKIFLRIFSGVSTGLMLFVALYFFDQTIFPSRLIVLATWLLTIVLVVLGRYVLAETQRYFLRKGLGLHNLVLIIEGQNDFDLAEEINKRPRYGYKIVSIITSGQGIAAELKKVHDEIGIDEVLQANLSFSNETNEEILRFTHNNGIKFNYVPSILEIQQTNLTISSLAGIPIIQLKNTPLEGWGRVVKRLMDITISSLALIIASPIFAAAAAGVKLNSRGKILFIQERYGQGRSFRFLKFRSMYQNLSVGTDYGGDEADKVRKELWKVNARHGPFLKIKNDPRVTAFGRFIRRTKIDELPQLFNVLKGEMSLVGPRAHVLEEVDLYREKYKRQFTIKPGITGLTQITQAKIPNLPFEEEIRLDTFYIENWSLALDLSILFKTFLVLFRPSGKKENY